MTATHQLNALDISYNGWCNHATWNVSLWINNDECLYNLAMEAGDYQTFVNWMVHEYNRPSTPDGVRYDDPDVNVIQINSEVFDF